jgi:hypothetical protein
MKTAQILAIFAFLLSWSGGFIIWGVALIPFLLQQILWCRRYHKIFMIIDALTCLIVGGLYIAVTVAVADAIFLQEFMIIPLFAALLWMLSGLLTLIFVVSGKHARYEELWNAKRANAETEAVAVAIELEGGRATPMSPHYPTVDHPTAVTNVTLDISEPIKPNQSPPLVLAEMTRTNKSKKPREETVPTESPTSIRKTTNKPKKRKESHTKKKRAGQKTG